MAQKGYLRITMDKTTTKGQPFVSALIVKDPADTTGGDWYSIFDAWWFGGTSARPSRYDIRNRADKENPALVVFEFEVSKDGKYKSITAIRPDGEKWEMPTVSNQEQDPPDEARSPKAEAAMGITQHLEAAQRHLGAALELARKVE
jgi:hypothetical protein